MKKILWLSHILPYPLESGVILRSFNLIKELSKQHEVTLLAFNQKDNCATKTHIDEAVNLLSQYCKVADVVDIPSEKNRTSKLSLMAIGALPHQTYTNLWLKSTKYKRLLNELVLAEQYDVIHYDTISLAQYWQPRKGAKSSLNHHNIESLMMLRRSDNERNLLRKIYTRLEGLKLKKYERKVCKKFDINITCSDLDTERLKAISNVEQCVSIPNGVDSEFFKPSGATEKTNSLVFTGSLSWYPNVDAMRYFFDQVWPLLMQRSPATSITIIGKHPPAWLLDYQRENANIVLTGFVDDVRPYMDEAAVYICPIKDGGGTKLKVLNALSMGMCIVADPIACEGLDLNDREHVLMASDAEEYVDAILQAFSDDGLRAMIGRNARRVAVEKYEFVKIGEELSRAYDIL